MPKAFTCALGCKISYCDDREARKALARAGWTLVSDQREADLCLLTSCTVTMKADADLRKLARRIRKENPAARIWAYGCWANVSDRHEPLEELDLVVKGPGELEAALAAVPTGLPAEPAPAPERHRIFVKAQDGCNRFCAYCIVPFARGVPRSMPYAEIRDRVLEARRAGLKECVLSGIHLAAWQEDGQDLADLCRRLLAETDLPRLRVSSLDVTGATGRLRQLMKEEPRLLPQLHIPLQSGSDRVLRLMNRPVSRGQVLEAMEAFLEEIPRMMISTDIIVGFPGETEADFQETLAFTEKIPFGKVHYFPYSPRPGTAAAARVADFVQPAVKKEREERLRRAAQRAAERCRAPFLNQTFSVLVETRDREGWLGFTENYLRVRSKRELTPNEIVSLTVDGEETAFIPQ